MDHHLSDETAIQIAVLARRLYREPRSVRHICRNYDPLLWSKFEEMADDVFYGADDKLRAAIKKRWDLDDMI